MENEDRLLKRLADTWRYGYELYVRFWCDVYGGEPAAKSAEIAALEHMYAISPNSAEKAP